MAGASMYMHIYIVCIETKREGSRHMYGYTCTYTQGMRLPKKHTLMASEEDQSAKPVTAVCVCVQGGATTITKVFESVSNGTPV